jgi:hypothetical protein
VKPEVKKKKEIAKKGTKVEIKKLKRKENKAKGF